MNEIQRLFEKAGYNLEEDDIAADLCDDIAKRIREKAATHPCFLTSDKGGPHSIQDVVNNLATSILTSDETLYILANYRKGKPALYLVTTEDNYDDPSFEGRFTINRIGAKVFPDLLTATKARKKLGRGWFPEPWKV